MIQVLQSVDEYTPKPINVDKIPLDGDLEELQEKQPEIKPQRTLADVELEISVLKKWHMDIPEELLQEYEQLKQ